MSDRDSAPRARLHQLDDDTLIGVLVFAVLVVGGGLVVVRAHPEAAAGLGAALVLVAVLAARGRAAWRDRRAARHDPPAPGVIVGHVRGDWRGARRRPFRVPWPSFRQHVLIAGPTGRGKTFTFVEPFLRAHLSRRSTGVFYLDGKGDPIHEAATEPIAFDHVFNPEQPDRSACWNPLAGEDPITAANLFAAGLFPEAVAPDLAGSFYAARAVYAITRVAPAMAFTGYGTGATPRVKAPAGETELVDALVAAGVDRPIARKTVAKQDHAAIARQLAWLAFRPPDKQTPERLLDAIQRNWGAPQRARVDALYDVNPAQLNRVLFSKAGLQELVDALARAQRLAHGAERRENLAQLRHDLEGLLRLSERERVAVFQSLQNRLGYFLEPPFAQLCARSDFAVADVANGARLAILLPTGRFPNTAKPLGRVALSQFKNAVLASSPEREKIAVLDEFHNFVSGDFAAFLNQARSRGGGAIMAMQSLGDFPRDDAAAMLANISTAIVTPGCKPADAEYWAEVFGKEFRPQHSTTYQAPSPLDLGDRPMIRTQLVESYRFTATEISELDPAHALIQVTAGRRAWPVAKVEVERARG